MDKRRIMPTVTDIIIQSKNIDRANLYLDGEFCCGISRMVLATNNIKVGTEIDDTRLGELVFESEKDKAFNYALSYISRYTPTTKGMRNKLYEKGYNTRIVNYVIDKATGYGYLNDEEWARCYVEFNKVVKGTSRIRQELLAKGISRDIVDKVLVGVESDDDKVLDLAVKHSKGQDLDDPKYIARLVRFLQYRGFGGDIIWSTIDKLKTMRD